MRWARQSSRLHTKKISPRSAIEPRRAQVGGKIELFGDRGLDIPRERKDALQDGLGL